MQWHWIDLLSLLASLGSISNKCLDITEVTPKKYFVLNGRSLNISLETSKRITHQLSTHIFYIYVKEVLDYSSVNIIYNDDNFDIETVMKRLSSHGDQSVSEPPATINLEVWTSPDYNTFAKRLVKEVGSVGPPGRFGWFIPNALDFPVRDYYSKYNWDKSIQEVHWSFFMNRDMVQYFDIDDDVLQMVEDYSFNKDDSTDQYVCPTFPCHKSLYTPIQCKGQACAVLLAPQYNSTKFLIDQVEKTGILVKILWLGDNFRSALNWIMTINLRENAHTKPRRSVVFFHWFPSEIVGHLNDFISVQFKNNVSYNFTRGSGGFGYKYEIQRLVKLAWKQIQGNAHPLYSALKRFKLSKDDYHYLLGLYGKGLNTITGIACQWMKKNQQVWTKWKHYSQKAVIYIGGIFPMSSTTSYNGKGIAMGALLATRAINNNHSLLKDYELKLLVSDGRCQSDAVIKDIINFIGTRKYYTKLLGVLGPACSETVESIAGLSKHYKILIVSYGAEGASFSNRKKYPYFFRTVGENQHYKHAYMLLFERFGWQRVAALTEIGQKQTEYISLMIDDMERNGIKFITKKFPRDKSTEDMKYYLADLKNRSARIIIADVVENVARSVMCEAYKQEMTAKQGYVWFLPIWLNTNWYVTDIQHNNISEVGVNCTTKEMIEAITGYFSMTHAYFAEDNAMMQENMSVGEWREKNDFGIRNTNYAGFAYDAVWTYALALDELVNTDPEALSVLHSENATNKLVRIVEATDFHGVSGRIKFRGGPSRFSVITIVQWYDNKTHTIGHFYPNLTEHEPEIVGGVLKLNETIFQWFTLDGNVPKDGTLPPSSCAGHGLARVWVILHVIIAIIFIISMTGILLYMKRKNELEAEKTRNSMRSLGIPFNLISANEPDKWEIRRESVVINSKLGQGAFGTVYKGEADLSGTGWTVVAVKALKTSSTTEERLDFLFEAETMKRLDHRNIVRLLGVCSKEEPVYTIMEYMLHKDLKTYLVARRHLVKTRNVEEYQEVSPKRLTNMALEVARGLSYLAEMKFVHRDIASRNCLVNAQLTVKIGDFGMARDISGKKNYKLNGRELLPVRWMAPESVVLGVFTPASDVWSYGVLLYEMVTFGKRPFLGKSNTEVLEMVKKGQTLEIPIRVKPQLYGLIKVCWKRDAKERPTASEIVEYLAYNPTLLTPCVDVDVISSLQVEDTDKFSHHLDPYMDMEKRQTI